MAAGRSAWDWEGKFNSRRVLTSYGAASSEPDSLNSFLCKKINI